MRVEHDAGDAEALVEGAGGVDRVLAGERVGDEKHLVRTGRRLDLGDLGHQRLVDGDAAGGVEHDHVEAAEPRRLDRPPGDLHRRLAGDDRQRVDPDLLSEHRELLHRGRTPRVERRHQHAAAAALGEALGDLRGRRGFARTLQPHHHDGHRRHGVEIDGAGLLAEHHDQLIVHDLHDHLAGRDRLQHLGADGVRAHLVGEGAHHLERDVRLEQRTADLAQGRVDVLLGQRAAARELVEDA